MDLITRDELKAALASDAPPTLVMTLGEFGYRAKRIPGSLHVQTPEDAERLLASDDDIVVYCADEASPASRMAYELLKRAGHRRVRRYAGGVADWERAGLPLEGELA
jgi:rhodanese-related sulfurtransferase